MMNPDTRQVPYGVADFELIRRDNLYYVDKTMYLPMLETEARNIFFTRPRRFGKSLLINMLHAYYDCNKKDKFEQLFGDLWIGKHPTNLQGKYLVLYLDFSQVGGSIDQVEEKFEAERNLQGFFMAYFSLNDYYYTAPELELNHGYCDFFLLPDLTHYPTQHSYIIELKMLHKGDSEELAQKQWDEAVSQINRYAAAPRVEALRQGTELHKIIMQFEGFQLKRMEEVADK